ncbi:MAG: hypothetical protein ACLT98_12840 [Eggerthellaceae bacterium]
MQQKKNLRVLRPGGVDAPAAVDSVPWTAACYLVVDRVNACPFHRSTKRKPTDRDAELLFAWVMQAKSTPSLCRKTMRASAWVGQQNRVDSAKLACERAHERASAWALRPTAWCAFDAFFPFRDGVDQLATTASPPSSSGRFGARRRVIQACDEHGIAMVFPRIATSATRRFVGPSGRRAAELSPAARFERRVLRRSFSAFGAAEGGVFA